jgi:Putative zinc-finger
MSDVPTRLLREALRDRITPALSSGCIDIETLAAWSEGTLSARDRAAVESHASGCARCQGSLAAMARTAPLVPARSWWRASNLGWLVPLATAAVAVVVWINIPETRLEQTVAPPRAAEPSSSTSRSAPAAPAASSPTSARPSAPDSRPAESKDAEGAKAASAPPETVAPQRETRADERRATDATEAAQSALRRTESVNATPNGIHDTVARSASARALTKMAAAPTEVISPNQDVRWRILTGGGVERSIDGGSTWQTQSTGVPATLTAGYAPSPAICWLVGPGGIVVLTTDGRTWRRLPFPEAIDLASVRASDEATAIVTAADGRTFATIDGGNTWRAR